MGWIIKRMEMQGANLLEGWAVPWVHGTREEAEKNLQKILDIARAQGTLGLARYEVVPDNLTKRMQQWSQQSDGEASPALQH